MLWQILFGIIFLQIALSFSTEDENYDDNDIDSRIVGGSSTTIDQIPYQVFVSIGKYMCGGSIYSETIIITAAHCTNKDKIYTDNTKVRAGSTYYNRGGIVIPVKKIYQHAEYSTVTKDKDITILELSKPLPLDSITMKSIPIASYPRLSGVTAKVSGWGDMVENAKETPEAVRSVDVPLIDSETCRTTTFNRNKITSNMLCAGYTNKAGYDSCKGDSGGPLVHNGELIGIVSWGTGCAKLGYPGVYVDVFAMSGWIYDTVDEIERKQLFAPPPPPESPNFVFPSETGTPNYPNFGWNPAPAPVLAPGENKPYFKWK